MNDTWLAWLVGFVVVMGLVTWQAIEIGFSIQGYLIAAVVVALVGWLSVWVVGRFLR